ncbi:hypothetical protein [Streptomyces caeruleatus]|uniref:Uncharacterized protein n=1 Tax=Streptomyces caeruleatus TaxID=661399 RepID=A0A117RLV8_9ACTN|nr:hypothetical protein [Streptomyces caeruleatus]KUN97991.1 hypothetical protein AQJ67_28880 [Streptomyces caeruleatus]
MPKHKFIAQHRGLLAAGAAQLVPQGARVQVKEELRRGGGTRIELRLRDLVDPKQPSVDPAYAIRVNEVWLDLATNKDGSDRSTAIVGWQFREGGARSVVLHEMGTAMHPGHAGTAGARLACVNVPFE